MNHLKKELKAFRKLGYTRYILDWRTRYDGADPPQELLEELDTEGRARSDLTILFAIIGGGMLCSAFFLIF